MKVSYHALRELVQFDLTPLELADKLTLVGFEVEEVVDLGTWAEGVVVGKLVACVPHPQADKLQVCTVDIGSGELLTIVCGAANARAGILAPVAVVGTYLPIKELTIQKAALRGVISEGMLCSLAELGLEKKSDGIHIFSEDVALGSDVRPLLGLTDAVLDITSTANRADALSLVGIAREVAAFTGGILRLPMAEVPLIAQNGLAVVITSSQACPAYIATVVTGITIAPSPAWLIAKLERAGLRAINNVVDITNLVLLEWGQPLHAFDRDRLPTGALGVRFATEGETLTTLDDTARVLKSQNLLITSADQPVALAGIMGGATSEVEASTTAIVLEAALFDPAVIRRSARAQGLRTEASTRYERGVDSSTLEMALNRALSLLVNLAGGILSAQTKVDYRSQQSLAITLRPNRVAGILGQEFSSDLIENSLRGYGFDLIPEGTNYRVLVPEYRRRDVQTEIDLIEEIARWVGYDHLPTTLPQASAVGKLLPEELVLRQIRAILRGCGLTELFHNTLTPLRSGVDLSSKRAQTEARFGTTTAQVTLLNPLNADYGAVRSELLPGLLAAYAYNLDQGNGALQGFEIGRVVLTEATGYQEVDYLGAILGGATLQADWQHRAQTHDFFSVKGILENLAQVLGLSFSYTPNQTDDRLHPGRAATLTSQGVIVGSLGQLHPRLVQAEGLPTETFVFSLNLDVLLEQVLARKVRCQTFSAYPAVDRDIAFFCNKAISVAQLLAVIRRQAGELLEDVLLFDEYIGSGVPENSRSLGFRVVYRAMDRTLTDSQVSALQQQIRTALVEQFQVQLRS